MSDQPVFTPHGKHLIAGAWVAGDTTFASEPAHGPVHQFSVGTPALVDEACRAAEEAFWTYGYTTREARAKFLHAIADEIAVMHRGRVVRQGPKAQVLSPPFDDYTELLLASVPEMREGWLEEVIATRKAATPEGTRA